MKEPDPLARKLLPLCDEISETSRSCAFLLEAYAAMTLDEETLSKDVALGGAHLSSCTQQRLLDIKSQFHQIQDSLRPAS